MQTSGSKSAKVNTLDRILFNYIIPFLDQQYIVKPIKKVPIKKISKLEEMILRNVNKKKDAEKIKITRKIDNKVFDFLKETDLLENIEEKDKINDYRIELTRAKETKQDYSVSIQYESTPKEERLDISIKYDQKEKKIKDKLEDKQDYNLSIIKKREDKSGYSVKIKYEDNYQQERLSINYKIDKQRYLDKRENSLQDFSDRVPGKHVHVFPESLLGGILGFTYLGENFMGLREDMVGNKMVNIHEAIHTPDEYETRVLTSWIMSKEKPKYIK